MECINAVLDAMDSGKQGVCFPYTLRDFHARVVQHECDHLDGVLYPLRITDMRRFGFIEELLGTSEKIVEKI